MLAVVVIVASYSSKQANRWDLLGGGMRFLTIVEFILWIGGLSALIYLFAKRVYPFDREAASDISALETKSPT